MRTSRRLQGEALQALHAETDRDRARGHANIDSMNDLLTALEAGRDEDVREIQNFAANLQAKVNQRYEAISFHIKGRIAEHEAHLRDLDGNEPEGEGEKPEGENVTTLPGKRKAG